MVKKLIDRILSLIPDEVSGFDGSDYPLPVKTTFLGDEEINISALKKTLAQKQDEDVKLLLEPVLLAAELYEASLGDREQFFITDIKLQGLVFMGSKWKAGWVLVLGGDDQIELIDKLKEKSFMIFTDILGIPDTYYIGNRETSPVYFLQMMVRYGLVWGRIVPGDDHEMGHFLEKDMPGFIIINEDLPPLKYLVALGLMKLGAPAVVPSTFPFPYGNRIVADIIDDKVSRGMSFSNLRIRYYNDEVISLPDFCNPAYGNEKFEKGYVLGGNENSFICVKASKEVERSINVIGEPSDGIGILIEIEHENLSDDLTLIIEQTAQRSINFIQGIRAYMKWEALCLEIHEGRKVDSEKIGQAIYSGIRLQYPRLEKIKIDIIYENDILKTESGKVHEYKDYRKQLINGMSEENTEEMCVCTECRPFSLEHTCILTPDRVPMCASRTYFTVKAAAFFGVSPVPFQRQLEKDIPLKDVFKKGRVIDADRGEYEGCNQIYKDMTKGKLKRVYLHSLRGYPHTSCGCFQNLAFWIEEVKGIGIMSRASKVIAPTGQSWAMLANRAGGKQSDGIMGVSNNYICSEAFLRGDGGIGNVVWVDSELYNKISKSFLPGQKVATEKDVENMEELKQFLRIIF